MNLCLKNFSYKIPKEQGGEDSIEMNTTDPNRNRIDL